MLDQAKVKSGDTVQTFQKITTGKYNSNNLVLHQSAETNEEVDLEDSTVAEIRESVGKYGGFYIAKYEAGIADIEGEAKNNSRLVTKTSTDGSVKPLSQVKKGVWDAITRTDALTVSKAMIPSSTGAKSTLISGECWDTALAWITGTNDATYAENSTGKGNYNESTNTNEWKNKITTTGKLQSYGVNNIFDMAGNAWEFTSENGKSSKYQVAVYRGGRISDTGLTAPAASRYGGSIYASTYVSFRVVMYR